MGLLDKLLQRRKAASETAPASLQPDQIQVFDESGRLISLTKETWRTQVLPGMLSTNRDNPDVLYKIIVGTLQDGWPADIAEAAEHLYRTDPNHLRAACAWASVLVALRRIDDAEQILRSHIDRYGEDGYVVTNLAKVYAARDENERAAAILWHALELEPNQEMAIGWFAALAHDRDGEKARAEAWERIAALPGSWRAQLWLARNALEAHDTPRAVAFYRQSLAWSGKQSQPTSLSK